MEHAQEIIEFIGKVVTTAAAVLVVLWRVLNKMITDKIKEQLAVVTETTSKAVEDLRTELHKHAQESERKGEERADRITARIDELFTYLANHGGK